MGPFHLIPNLGEHHMDIWSGHRAHAVGLGHPLLILSEERQHGGMHVEDRRASF